MIEYFIVEERKFVEVAARPPVWRVLHELELPPARRITPDNRPEVRAMFPNSMCAFPASWQRLSYNANLPWLSRTKWTVFYSNNLWITNDQGFNEPGDPRANYILNTNLDKELPRVENLTCGGNLVTGYVEGPNLVVSTLNVNDPLPSVTWLLQHPEFCTYAVSMDSNGTPRRFPQGQQPNGYLPDLLHPFIADRNRFPKMTIPLWRLVPWTAPERPDLYRIYLPYGN